MEDVRHVICIASLGHYRLRPMRYVKQRLGGALKIFAGSPAYDKSIVTLTPNEMDLVGLNNHYLPGTILIQKIPLQALLSAQSVILDLNPRVPHVWLVLLLRKLLRRPTVLWGHAFPRAGQESYSERLRSLLRQFSDGLLTYTLTDAEKLRRVHHKKKVFTAPNSLYLRDEMAFAPNSVRTNIIYVGRLDPAKKVPELIRGFELAAPALDPSCRLVIVGEGVQRRQLEEMIAQSPFESRIDLKGHISEYEVLKQLYSRSFLSASPGYVGLSITQSFAFGVPMIISKEENHSPEIEAARAGENCEFFETGNTESLANAIVSCWSARAEWHRRGTEIVNACAVSYSVEAMGEGIIDALTHVLQR